MVKPSKSKMPQKRENTFGSTLVLSSNVFYFEKSSQCWDQCNVFKKVSVCLFWWCCLLTVWRSYEVLWYRLVCHLETNSVFNGLCVVNQSIPVKTSPISSPQSNSVQSTVQSVQSTVQFSSVQFSSVQFSSVHNSVQSTVQFSSVHSLIQFSPQSNSVQSTVQFSSVHSPVQSTVQFSSVHSLIQYSPQSSSVHSPIQFSPQSNSVQFSQFIPIQL